MSWLNDNRFKIGLVGSILGVAWLGGRYFDYMDEQQSKPYGAEKKALKKPSCCCGATKSKPCLCMIQGEMNCSAKSPMCPCYEEIAMGTKVEMEHTKSKEKAEKIAKEHIAEHPDYYSRLKKAGLSAETFEAPRKKIDFSGLPIQYKTYRMNSAICISKPDDSGDSLCGKAQSAMYCGTSNSQDEITCQECKTSFRKMTDEEKEKVRGYGEYGAETFEADPEYDGMNYHGDLPYDMMKDAYAQARKERLNPVIRDGKRVSPSERMNWEYIEMDDETIDSGYITAYFEDPNDSRTEHYLIFDFDVSDVTPHEYGFWNYDNFNFDPVNPKGYANYIIGHGEDEGLILSSHRFTGMSAETFEAMSFKQWSDDEMHEPKHGGSHMQFDDWLDDEIKSHGDIPLSKWGYEEEHDEKEHQHSESFGAENHLEGVKIDEKDLNEVADAFKSSGLPVTLLLLPEHGRHAIHILVGRDAPDQFIRSVRDIMKDLDYSYWYRDGKKLYTISGDIFFGKGGAEDYTEIKVNGGRIYRWERTMDDDTFDAETMADRFAKRFPDHKILRDKKGMIAKFRKNQLDDRDWVGWVQLTGHGKQPCVLASDLKVGDHIVYNTGATAEVVEIKPKAQATLTVSAVSEHDGKTYDRDYRKTAWIPILMSWNIERRAKRLNKNAESFNAEVEKRKELNKYRIGHMKVREYDDGSIERYEADERAWNNASREKRLKWLKDAMPSVGDKYADYTWRELTPRLQNEMNAESFNVETFAAYASADLTKRIREDLKKAFPNLKFSVSKSSGSLGVDVILVKGDIDFSDIHDDIPYHKRSWERWNDPKPTWKGDIQLNQYHLDSYNPKYTELFEKILRIIRGEDWYDDSDAMTDYFNTAYYIHWGIGKWKKPYVYDPTLKKGTKPTLESLGGKGMGDAYSQFDLDAETFNAPLVNEMYSPKGWSIWGRELRYQGKQEGKIIGNTNINGKMVRKNDPLNTYTGKNYVRWGEWALDKNHKLVFDEVSQEVKPNDFEEWMDVINETNERLNPTSFVRGAETFDADWEGNWAMYERIVNRLNEAGFTIDKEIKGEKGYSDTWEFKPEIVIPSQADIGNLKYRFVVQDVGGEGEGGEREFWLKLSLFTDITDSSISDWNEEQWNFFEKEIYDLLKEKGIIKSDYWYDEYGFNSALNFTYGPDVIFINDFEKECSHENLSIKTMEVLNGELLLTLDCDNCGKRTSTSASLNQGWDAETFEAVAVAPKGVEAKKTIEKVMLNEYLKNTAARESIREALTNEIALNSGGYKGIRSKMQKNKQPKMLTESYDERLREEYEG